MSKAIQMFIWTKPEKGTWIWGNKKVKRYGSNSGAQCGPLVNQDSCKSSLFGWNVLFDTIPKQIKERLLVKLIFWVKCASYPYISRTVSCYNHCWEYQLLIMCDFLRGKSIKNTYIKMCNVDVMVNTNTLHLQTSAASALCIRSRDCGRYYLREVP